MAKDRKIVKKEERIMNNYVAFTDRIDGDYLTILWYGSAYTFDDAMKAFKKECHKTQHVNEVKLRHFGKVVVNYGYDKSAKRWKFINSYREIS